MALALLSVAPAARAAPRAALVWERGPGAQGCITPARLERAAERIAERPLFRHEGRADLVLFGRIERAEGSPRWRAVFELGDADGRVLGRRELREDAAGCGALDEAIAVIVSLLVEEQEQAEVEAPAPAPSAPAAEIAPRPVFDAVVPVEPPRAPRPPRDRDAPPARGLETTAGLLGQTGLLPGPGLGVGAWLRLPLAVHLEPGLLYYAPRTASAGAVGAPMQVALADLAACLAPVERARVRVLGCGGLSAGTLVTDARALGSSVSLHVLAQAHLGLRAELALTPRVWLGLAVGAALPFPRERIILEAIAGSRVLLHRVSVVVGLAALRLAIRGW